MLSTCTLPVPAESGTSAQVGTYDQCGLIGPDEQSRVPRSIPAGIAVAKSSRRPDKSGALSRGGAMHDFHTAWAAYRTHLLVDRDASPATVSQYRSTLHRWHRSLEHQHIEWEQAGPDELTRFLARPAAAGRRKGQPLSVNMRHNDTVAVCGFYRFCALAGLLERDPMVLVHPPRRREGPPRSFILSQLRTLFQAAHDDDRMYLLLWLGYGEGLRRGEMAGLDLSDFEREPWPGRLRVLGKGRRLRWVPLKPEVRAALDRHLGDRANLTAGPLVANHRFPHQPLAPGTVGDMLAAHIRACGIKVGSAHWLRHSSATWALSAAEGENIEDVREFLGHSDSRVTRLYTSRFAWNVRRNVIDKLPNPEGPLAAVLLLLLLLGPLA
jgi:site-specific recombinase XerD